MKTSPDTPEQRRRRLMPRTSIYTLAQSGFEAQRRFLLRKRLAFTLAVMGAMVAMWLATTYPPGRPSLLVLAGLFLSAVVLWVLTALLRHRGKLLPFLCMLGGFVALGAACGWLAHSSPAMVLTVPTLVVGLTLGGTTLNTWLLKKRTSAFRQFLLTLPWFSLAICIAHFLAPGEGVLAASGLMAIILTFLLHHAAPHTLGLYQSGEYLAAAADVLPLACIHLVKSWTGQK